MTRDDKHFVIDWIGMLSPKGILESGKVNATREEIQEFLDEAHDILLAAYVEDLKPNQTCRKDGCPRCEDEGVRFVKVVCKREDL